MGSGAEKIVGPREGKDCREENDRTSRFAARGNLVGIGPYGEK